MCVCFISTNKCVYVLQSLLIAIDGHSNTHPGFADVCRQLSLPSEPFHPPRRLSFYSVDLLILATDGLLVDVPLMACQSSMNLVLF